MATSRVIKSAKKTAVKNNPIPTKEPNKAHSSKIPNGLIANLYRNVVQYSLEGFILFNSEGEILDVNDAFCRTTGYRRDELLSMKLQDLDVDFIQSPEKALETIKMRVKESGTFEVQHRCKDGHIIDVWVHLKSLDAHPGYFFCFHQDITEQKKVSHRLKETDMKYRFLLDNMPVAIWDLDFSGAKRYIDKLRLQGVTDFEKYFKEHPDDLVFCHKQTKINAVNKNVKTLYGIKNIVDLADSFKHLMLAMASNKNNTQHYRVPREITMELIDGKTHHKREIIISTPNGKTKYAILERFVLPGYENTWSKVISIAVDITPLRQTEIQLNKYQEHLEELVEKRSAELEQTNKQLQQQMKQRVEFTRALVHEMKTPLTPMLLASDILINTIKDESAKEIAKTIYNSACTLDARIDELLDVARGEIGMLKLDPTPCDILQIINDVSQYVSYLFKSRNQVFSLDMPDYLPNITIDAQRIRQVLLNLLGNASRYTPKGGQISLKVIVTQSDVTIEIEDNGIGIPPEKRENIFIPYSILATRGNANHGMGLGLALSKMLVDLHGGEIWCDNKKKGTGSIFGFSLPYEVAKNENTGD